MSSEQIRSVVSGSPELRCGFAGCSTSTPTSVENGIFLTHPTGAKDQLTAGGYDTAPAFSPDGRSFVYSSLRQIDDKVQTITVVRHLDSGHEVELVPPKGVSDEEPVWSPDGRLVAVLRNAYGYPTVLLWPADGSAQPTGVPGTGDLRQYQELA